MFRASGVLLLLALLSACGGCAGDDSSENDRCVSAKNIVEKIEAYGKKLEDQDPAIRVDDFYIDLATSKVNPVAFGLVENQQSSLQVISDNPTCFGVSQVSDARRALKRIDPAIADAFRLLMVEQSK
jgi:hypothetical protein